MEDSIKNELEQEEITPFHKALLDHARGFVDQSRRHMNSFYRRWDDHNDVYRGVRRPDQKDKAAAARGEPTKMVVPLSYAQVQTFVSFCMSTYYQRDVLFELLATGEEDHAPAKIAQALIARDLSHSVFEARLYQFLLDIARFGLGVLKTGWVRELENVRTMMPGNVVTLPSGEQIQGPETEQMVQQTKFLGTKVVNVSPYRFFPDVRLPISRFQEGEFCASEEEVTYTTLREWERDGQVAGVQHLKGAMRGAMESTGRRFSHNSTLSGETSHLLQNNSHGVHLLTECQMRIVPAEFEVEEVALGESTTPEKWNIWYVNDARVLKAEPLGYAHDQFTYDVGEFSPDQHELLNEGLASVIDQLQDVHTWFINSHITSVRKTISNYLVVDPAGIRMEDLNERNPVLRLKPEAQRTGVDKWVKQLEVRDVTQNHMQDAKALQDIVEIVTGINANALGQFNQGRRSATEARNVNSATAARLKMVALLVFRTALEPLGRKMLSNLRDGLDEQTAVQVMGAGIDPMAMQRLLVDRTQLSGNYDFRIFDGTLPSERTFQAQALQEFMAVLLQNPMLLEFLGYDPRLLIKEWLELRNISNPERFMFTQARVMELQMQLERQSLYGNGDGGQGDVGQGAAGTKGAARIPMVSGAGRNGGGTKPAARV